MGGERGVRGRSTTGIRGEGKEGYEGSERWEVIGEEWKQRSIMEVDDETRLSGEPEIRIVFRGV